MAEKKSAAIPWLQPQESVEPETPKTSTFGDIFNNIGAWGRAAYADTMAIPMGREIKDVYDRLDQGRYDSDEEYNRLVSELDRLQEERNAYRNTFNENQKILNQNDSMLKDFTEIGGTVQGIGTQAKDTLIGAGVGALGGSVLPVAGTASGAMTGARVGNFVGSIHQAVQDADTNAVDAWEKVLQEGGSSEQAEQAYKDAFWNNMPTEALDIISSMYMGGKLVGSTGKILERALGNELAGTLASGVNKVGRFDIPAKIGTAVAKATNKSWLGQGVGVGVSMLGNGLEEGIQEPWQDYATERAVDIQRRQYDPTNKLNKDVRDFSVFGDGGLLDYYTTPEGRETAWKAAKMGMAFGGVGGLMSKSQFTELGTAHSDSIQAGKQQADWIEKNNILKDKGNLDRYNEVKETMGNIYGLTEDEKADLSVEDVSRMYHEYYANKYGVGGNRQEQGAVTQADFLNEITGEETARRGLMGDTATKYIDEFSLRPDNETLQGIHDNEQVLSEEQVQDTLEQNDEDAFNTDVNNKTINDKTGSYIEKRKRQNEDKQKGEKKGTGGLKPEYGNWKRIDEGEDYDYGAQSQYRNEKTGRVALVTKVNGGYTIQDVTNGEQRTATVAKTLKDVKSFLKSKANQKTAFMSDGTQEQVQQALPKEDGVISEVNSDKITEDAEKNQWYNGRKIQSNKAVTVHSMQDLHDYYKSHKDLMSADLYAEVSRQMMRFGIGDANNTAVVLDLTNREAGGFGSETVFRTDPNDPNSAIARAVVRLYAGADLATAAHEIAHLGWMNLSDQDRATFAKWAEKTQGEFVAKVLGMNYDQNFRSYLIEALTNRESETSKALWREIQRQGAVQQTLAILNGQNAQNYDLAVEERFAWEFSNWYAQGYIKGSKPQNIIERILNKACATLQGALNLLSDTNRYLNGEDGYNGGEINSIFTNMSTERIGQPRQTVAPQEQVETVTRMDYAPEMGYDLAQGLPNVADSELGFNLDEEPEQNLSGNVGTTRVNPKTQKAQQQKIKTGYGDNVSNQETLEQYKERMKQEAEQRKEEKKQNYTPTPQYQPKERNRKVGGYEQTSPQGETLEQYRKREAEEAEKYKVPTSLKAFRKLLTIVKNRKDGWQRALQSLRQVDPNRFRSAKTQDGNNLWEVGEEYTNDGNDLWGEDIKREEARKEADKQRQRQEKEAEAQLKAERKALDERAENIRKDVKAKLDKANKSINAKKKPSIEEIENQIQQAENALAEYRQVSDKEKIIKDFSDKIQKLRDKLNSMKEETSNKSVEKVDLTSDNQNATMVENQERQEVADSGKTENTRGTEDLQGNVGEVQGRGAVRTGNDNRTGEGRVGQNSVEERSEGNGKDIPLLKNSKFKSVYNAREEKKTEVKDWRDLSDSDQAKQVYVDALTASKEANGDYGVYVSEQTVESLKDCKVVLHKNKMAGFAITPDGNIVGVFSNPKNPIRGILNDMIFIAHMMGGNSMDCFGSFLLHGYRACGFTPVARTAFDETYYPADNPANNTIRKEKPDVFFLVKDNDNNTTYLNKMNNGEYKNDQIAIDDIPLIDSEDSYSDALGFQGQVLKETQKKENKNKSTKEIADSLRPKEETVTETQETIEQTQEEQTETQEEPKEQVQEESVFDRLDKEDKEMRIYYKELSKRDDNRIYVLNGKKYSLSYFVMGFHGFYNGIYDVDNFKIDEEGRKVYSETINDSSPEAISIKAARDISELQYTKDFRWKEEKNKQDVINKVKERKETTENRLKEEPTLAKRKSADDDYQDLLQQRKTLKQNISSLKKITSKSNDEQTEELLKEKERELTQVEKNLKNKELELNKELQSDKDIVKNTEKAIALIDKIKVVDRIPQNKSKSANNTKTTNKSQTETPVQSSTVKQPVTTKSEPVVAENETTENEKNNKEQVRKAMEQQMLLNREIDDIKGDHADEKISYEEALNKFNEVEKKINSLQFPDSEQGRINNLLDNLKFARDIAESDNRRLHPEIEQAEKQKKIEEENKEYNGFLDNMSPITRGKTIKQLSQKRNYGKDGGIMTKKAFIEKEVKNDSVFLQYITGDGYYLQYEDGTQRKIQQTDAEYYQHLSDQIREKEEAEKEQKRQEKRKDMPEDRWSKYRNKDGNIESDSEGVHHDNRDEIESPIFDIYDDPDSVSDAKDYIDALVSYDPSGTLLSNLKKKINDYQNTKNPVGEVEYWDDAIEAIEEEQENRKDNDGYVSADDNGSPWTSRMIMDNMKEHAEYLQKQNEEESEVEEQTSPETKTTTEAKPKTTTPETQTSTKPTTETKQTTQVDKSDKKYQRAVELVLNNHGMSPVGLRLALEQEGINVGYVGAEKYLTQMEEDGLVEGAGEGSMRIPIDTTKANKKTKKGNNPDTHMQAQGELSDENYFDAIKRGDIDSVRRMVEQKAIENGFKDAIPEQAETYKIRTGAPPKKVLKKVYKVFVVDENGNPTALFVNGGKALPQGVWLDAVEAWHFTGVNGKEYAPTTVNPNAKNNRGGSGVPIPNEQVRKELIKRGFLKEGSTSKDINAVAYRPGWHGGDMPFFPQAGKKTFGTKNGTTNYDNIHLYNQVIFECEMANEKDYTEYHTVIDKKTGKKKIKYHDMRNLPKGGSYKFATNPMTNAQELGTWYISDSLKIIRALSEEECNDILEKHGFKPQEWQAYGAKDNTIGKMDLEKLGYTGQKSDAYRKTLAPITYDDNGNIIPLSKRFDRSNPDTRFQEAGQAAENQTLLTPEKEAELEKLFWKLIRKKEFHGMDKRWSKDSLDYYRSLYNRMSGKDFNPEYVMEDKAFLTAIKNVNDYINKHYPQYKNLYRGVDGHWRFEFSDKDAHFLNGFEKLSGKTLDTTLEKILKHDNLYKFYSKLKEMPVHLVRNEEMQKQMEDTENNYYAMYDPNTKSIYINSDMFEKDDVRNSLLHEIQHAIQDIEGFANGTNDNELNNNYDFSEGEKQAVLTEKRSNMSDEELEKNPRYKTLNPEEKTIMSEQRPVKKVAKSPDTKMQSNGQTNLGYIDKQKDIYSVTFTKSAQKNGENQKKIAFYRNNKSYWRENKDAQTGSITFTRALPYRQHQKTIIYDDINGKTVGKKKKTKVSEYIEAVKDQIIKWLFNDKHFLKKAARNVGAIESYMRMMVMKDQGAVAGAAIEDGIVKHNGKNGERTKSLNSIIEAVGEENQTEFLKYCEAFRVLDLKKRGIEQKMKPKDAIDEINKVKNSKNAKLFEEQRKNFIEYNHELLWVLVDGGFITEKQYDKFIQNDPNFIPLAKNMDELEAYVDGFKDSKTMINVQHPMHKIGTSMREVVNPFLEMQKRTVEYYVKASRNKAGLIFVHDIAEAIAQTAGGNVVAQNQGMIRKLASRDKNGKPISHDNKQYVFYVWENGQKQYYQVADREIYVALKSFDAEQMGALSKIMNQTAGRASRLVRNTATMTPDFGLRNLVRDNVEAFISSEHGFLPLVDSLWGMYQMANDTQWFREYQALNGEHMSLNRDGEDVATVEHDIKDNVKFYKSIVPLFKKDLHEFMDKKRSVPARLKSLLKLVVLDIFPLQALYKGNRRLNDYLETGTRIGEYRNARMGYRGLYGRLFEGKGNTIFTNDADLKMAQMDKMFAAYKAKDITLNFGQHGRLGKEVNKYIPFFNASLQGIYKVCNTLENMARADDTRLKQELWFKFVLMGAMGMAAALAGTGDDDYDEAPEYEHDNFWVFKNGFRIPKDQLFGRLVGGTVEKATRQYLKDGDVKKKELLFDILGNFAIDKCIPAIVDLAMGLYGDEGYDTFRKKPVVPSYMVDWFGYQKKDLSTSKLAADISEGLLNVFGVDVAAKKIDFVFSKTLSNLGNYTKGLYDLGTNPNERMTRGAEPEDKGGFAEWSKELPYPMNTIVGTFATNRNTFQSISDFYNRYKELRKYEHAPERMSKAEKKVWEAYKKAYKDDKKYRDALKAIKTDKSLTGAQKRERADKIFKQQIRMARKLRDYEKKQGLI